MARRGSIMTPSSYETADELDQNDSACEEDSDDGDIDEDASTLKKTRQAFEQAVQAFVEAAAPSARYDGDDAVRTEGFSFRWKSL